MALSKKQKKFADEYLIDCNATQAAIRAGYSEKTANEQGARLLANVSIKNYITEQLEKIHNEKIADATEVLMYLTSVLRGESQSSVVVVEGTGDGCSEARTIEKNPDERERLKAAELIGKRYGLYIEKSDIAVRLPIVLVGEDELEE